MPRRNNDTWNHFDKRVGVEKVATCKYCKKDLSYKGTTTNLKTHLRLKHISVYSSLVDVASAETRSNEGDRQRNVGT